MLVGDHAQLGAIQAGGLFRLLTHDLDAAQLATLANPIPSVPAVPATKVEQSKTAAL